MFSLNILKLNLHCSLPDADSDEDDGGQAVSILGRCWEDTGYEKFPKNSAQVLPCITVSVRSCVHIYIYIV